MIWASLALLFGISLSTRILPFLFAHKLKESALMHKLATFLPASIIVLLVIHTTPSPAALPEVLGILSVIIVHLAFRNTILSIGIGVTAYHLLLCMKNAV